MARIPYFSHKSNPRVDPPDFRISRKQAQDGLANGTLRTVTITPLSVQQAPMVGAANAGEVEVENRTRERSDTSLTLRTMEANVGIAGIVGTSPDMNAVRRAQAKVKFWGQRASWADRVVSQ